MAKQRTSFITENLEAHPAVEAWRQIDRRARRPSRIEVLKLEKRKCAVFRIVGVGPSGRPVIAKRRPALDGDLEVRLYVELLPTLSLPALELYGSVSDAEHSWLFLEDAGEVRYDPRIPTHHVLAVNWLADLHTAAATFRDWFPQTGTAYFREELRAAQDGVCSSLDHPSLSPTDVATLRDVQISLQVVEERWRDIEAACAGAPETLVHGDFVSKNVRVRTMRGGPELIAFDWETAGWATPAADLILLADDEAATRVYHSRIARSWPRVALADVDRLRHVGTVLRLVHAVRWETRWFRHAWIEQAVQNMTTYDHYLRAVTRDDAWLVA
jgi:preprotein translocase subunit Sss1